MSKKKKSHKHKSLKKSKKKNDKKHRSPSSSSASSSDDSASTTVSKSPSPERAKIEKALATTVETTKRNWFLSQKSESLLFEKDSVEEPATTFVWHKKNEKSGVDKYDLEQIENLNRRKKEEAKTELEKLKKRKIEREREHEEREREREFLQRQKEVEYHKEWEKQEDNFHFGQVKLRSKIRIEEARAKPIDLLAKYINSDDEDNTSSIVDTREPYTYLNGLTIRDLEDLLVDIRIYSDLEKNKHIEYWTDMTIITQDELKKLQRLNKTDSGADRQEGINQSVISDVTSMFKGKSYEQLSQLEQNINDKIKNQVGIDIGYWESVLNQLKAHMSRARIRERHQIIMVNKLHLLKTEQGISTVEQRIFPIRPDDDSQMFKKPTDKVDTNDTKHDSSHDDDNDNDDEDDADLDLTDMCIQAYVDGCYSPVLLQMSELNADVMILQEDEDYRRLEFRRNQMIGTGKINSMDIDEEFEKKARETTMLDIEMDEQTDDGAQADDVKGKNPKETNDSGEKAQEVLIERKYLWSDKYRPRKPRYYNRVHTGYDWNQYNKKHYDGDNPPPKTVQGYKFNIFYPDLIDKTQTPTYSITACKDNKDFAIIRFHTGPPYEDIGFKIVNREWDISHRHGFRNQFQNGIFQLWFHFRKWRYRR